MNEPSQVETLSFDRADIAPEAARATCGACSEGIASTYYGWGSARVCPPCHERLAKEHRKPGSLLRAAVYGSGAAALGAGIYYAISALTNMNFGLIAIFVGIAVGKAVRAGAGFEAKKRYRALAVLLAYASITATYVPLVLQDLETQSIALASVVALVLPVLMLMSFDNVMGLIILGIGVYEAWKLSAAPVIAVQGPFTLEAPTAEALAVEEAPAPVTLA